jgi:stage III sporulation protein AE
MKKYFLILLLLCFFATPVQAAELTAPEPSRDALELIPVERNSFGEDLWYVVTSSVKKLEPEIGVCCGVCLSVIAAVILTSVIGSFPGGQKNTVRLVTAIVVACLLFGGSRTLIVAASEAVREVSEYGKLLLPVLTAAMAAQGGVTGSAALYAGTAVFNAILGALISKVLVPMVYVYLVLSVANSAIGEEMLGKLRDFVKWLVSWCLKTILYVFTGYMAVTGVISGTTDAAALKVAKATISMFVPVVGGVLSEAAGSVLIGAKLAKNAAGLYGIFALLVIFLEPFLLIGCHYMMLKLTSSLCSVFASKPVTELLGDISSGMGLLLGMSGAVCLLLLIGVICYLRVAI